MKTKEIIKNNKLIAEFMGCVYFTKSPFSEETDYCEFREFIPYNGYGRVQTKELAFDSSWDWLMPVVEKIEDLGFYTEINTKIEAVWIAVVEFIKWYNKNH